MATTSCLPRVALAPAEPLASSRWLGRYELLEQVGRGATAEVWLARRPLMPGALKPCALKIIHESIAAGDRQRHAFLKEARLALKMSHANIASIFDVGEASGRLFMALEWVDGVHLRHFTERVRASEGPLAVDEACYLIGEILQGLRYAHGLRVQGQPLGVVHRDIAPHNVLVSAAGEVKLLDFGIARVRGEFSSGTHIKGRARYMAPEQFDGHAEQASDLFSVGAVFHELLDGQRFREGFDRGHDWHRVVERAPLPVLSRADVPPEVEALRVALLQPDPRQRIATADEALRWLAKCPCSTGALALRGRYQRCVGQRHRTGLTRPWTTVPCSTTDADTERAPRARSRSRGDTTTQSSPNAVVRHRAAPALRPRVRASVLQQLSWALWGLSAALATTALALFLAPAEPRPQPCIHEPEVAAGAAALLSLRGNDLPRAQVRIDMQVVEVAEGHNCWLSPGVHELQWRRSPEQPWTRLGSRMLTSAKEHLLRVSEDGLVISAYDP
ncbi:MAG: serine/threonine-protein kinase [Myxococcota bacterium]